MSSKTPSGRTYSFIDTSAFTDEEILNFSLEKDNKVRQTEIMKRSKNECSPEDTLKVAKITFIEEATIVLLFLFGVPGAVYSMPFIGYLLYKFVSVQVFIGFAAFLLLLAYLPVKFKMSNLVSWPAIALLRYFSFKGVFTQTLDANRPYILVAPPHGVFPFGNIVTMIAFPSLTGFAFKGLAASSALRMPVFRQLLCAIGVVDASAASATKHLKQGYTLGISTGGVAEVFETNTVTGDEAIVLRERKGLVKLAIRTGTALVPSYLFGNTKLLRYCCMHVCI